MRRHWVFGLAVFAAGLTHNAIGQEAPSCAAACVAKETVKQSGGTIGGVEEGAKCGSEEATQNRPKQFSRGAKWAPYRDKGGRFTAAGITKQEEGKATARVARNGEEVVVDSSCWTIGKGFKTETAKYRWWGTWTRTLTDTDKATIGADCAKQCTAK